MTIEQIQELAAKVAGSKGSRILADNEANQAQIVFEQKTEAADAANSKEDADIQALKDAVAEYSKEIAG